MLFQRSFLVIPLIPFLASAATASSTNTTTATPSINTTAISSTSSSTTNTSEATDNNNTRSPGEVICGECNDLPILDGGKYGNQTNATVLAMPDEQRLGQKWMIDSDQRISLRPPTDPTQATFCLGETIDDGGGSYVRTEYCGDGPDSGGSKINQIWNLIDVEIDT